MRTKVVDEKYVTSREVYKAVKKYDHRQFDEFCSRVYMNGYDDGRNSVPGVDVKEMMKVIGEVKGVGPALKGKILSAIEEKFGKLEKGGQRR